MIRGVRVINQNGDDVLMTLDGLERGPFSLWSIEGLDQGDADINVDEIANTDGAIFNSARQTSKELTITALLNNDIQLSREYAYKYFPLKKKITIIVYLDDRDNGGMKSYITEGYVKSNPVDIFAKTCAMRATIIRTKPYFYENYSHGEYFNIYDTVGIASSAISINDFQFLTNFVDHTYRFVYVANTYYWNMYIDEGITYSLVDVRKLGISFNDTLSSGENSFKVRANPYINYKVRSIDFFHAGTSPHQYSLVPSSGSLYNDGADTGIYVSLMFKNDISYVSLFSTLRTIIIENVFPNDLDSGYTWISVALNRLASYSDFSSRGIKENDKLIINTSTFNKDVRLYLSDENKEISILGTVDVFTKTGKPWPYIQNGNNVIKAKIIYIGGVEYDLSFLFSSSKLEWSKEMRGI